MTKQTKGDKKEISKEVKSGESTFLSRVEGRGFHVEGEGAMSRVEGNIFFSKIFFWKR